MDPLNKRPFRVTLIAWYYIICGAVTLYIMLSKLMHLEFRFRLTVFMLPVGIGLLRGNPNSLWWAKFWIILGYFGVSSLVALAASYLWKENPDDMKSIYLASWAPFILFGAFVYFLFLFVMHYLLYTAKAKAYFNRSITSEAD